MGYGEGLALLALGYFVLAAIVAIVIVGIIYYIFGLYPAVIAIIIPTTAYFGYIYRDGSCRSEIDSINNNYSDSMKNCHRSAEEQCLFRTNELIRELNEKKNKR